MSDNTKLAGNWAPLINSLVERLLDRIERLEDHVSSRFTEVTADIAQLRQDANEIRAAVESMQSGKSARSAARTTILVAAIGTAGVVASAFLANVGVINEILRAIQ